MKIELNKSLEIETQEDGSNTISLDEQMLEHSKRKEKIEQLKKELIVNPKWDIIEAEGKFYVVDFWDQQYRINVELREMFPMSYFHSPECDDDIIGYDHRTGSIIYDLWKIGKTEMLMSEGIVSDFQDTGYGIGKLLSSIKDDGFGDKIPPTHILPPDFINYHQNLQGAIYYEGFIDVSLVNDIGVREHQRLVLINKIEWKKKFFEESGHKLTEEDLNSHHREMERLEKEYQEFLEAGKSD
jgi:hypothetical protein